MPDVWGFAAAVAKFGLYLGILASAGTVFAGLLFHLARIRRAAFSFGLLGLAGAAAGFLLQGAALTGEASGMTDPEMLGLLWATHVGTALSLRMAGLALLLGGLAFGRVGLWVSAAGGMLALFSFAVTGHVPDHDTPWLNALLVFHLGAVALWIGILTPLKRLASSSRLQEAAALGHRFGRAAAVFVPLLILAGLVMGTALTGSLTTLVVTGYGQALLLKSLLVAGLLGLAAMNKFRFVPRLAARDSRAAVELSRSISLEWGLVLAILLTTACLTSVLTLPS